MNKYYDIFNKFVRMAWVKCVCLSFVMLWAGFAQGQLKAPLSYGSDNPVVATHSEGAKLFTVSIKDATPLQEVYEVCVYNGNYWTCLPEFNVPGPYPTLGNPNYTITSVIEFRGEVYIGGKFVNGSVLTEQSNLFKYDVADDTWTSVANNIKTKDKGINQMIVWKDTLIAAGSFTQAGTSSASNIARFDGTNWSFLGNGSGFEGANGEINDLELINNNIFIGGDFDEVAGKNTGSVARWTSFGEWGGLGDPFDKTPTYHLESFKSDLVAVGKKVSGNPDIRVFKNGLWELPGGLNELICAESNCVAQPVVINNKLYVYGPFLDGTDTVDLVLSENSAWNNTNVMLPDGIRFQQVANYNVAFGSFVHTDNDVKFNNLIGLKDNHILISGNVYGDENNDCIFNSNENGISAQVIIRSKDFSKEFYLVETDADGKWEVEVSSSKAYTIEARFPKDKFVKGCTKKDIGAQTNGARIKEINLALDFSQANTDLKVSGANLFGKISPNNSESILYFYATNTGNTEINGKSIHIDFDSTLNIQNTEPIPADAKPGSITWTVNNLKPGETFIYKIILDPISKAIKTTLNFRSRTGTGAIMADSDVTDNYDTFNTTVDIYTPLAYKTVSTEGDFVKVDHLDYGIYFSNPSNYIARSVTIIDTLDTDLPLYEMRLLNQSHNTLRKINGNIYTVTFKDVNLLPAEFGKASTSGFFEYSFLMKDVKQKAIDQVFTNTATVVFDYVKEEKTNTVTSVLQKFSNVTPVTNQMGIKIYPNPCNQSLQVENFNRHSKELKIYTSQGALVQTILVNTLETHLVNLSQYSNGIYIMSDGFSSTTFAIQH